MKDILEKYAACSGQIVNYDKFEIFSVQMQIKGIELRFTNRLGSIRLKTQISTLVFP